MFSSYGRARTGNFVGRYRDELKALFFVAAAFFCGAFLYSYNPRDPSWFYHATHMAPATNWCGPLGATIAALLVYLFGDASKLIVLLLLFGSYASLRGDSWRRDYPRLISLLLLVPLVAALLQFHQVTPRLAFVVGGSAAEFILALLYTPFDRVGAGLFLYTHLASCIIIASRLSFLALLFGVGRAARSVLAFVWEHRLVQRLAIGMYKLVALLCIKPLGAVARFAWRLLDGTAFDAVFAEMEDAYADYEVPTDNYSAPPYHAQMPPVQVGSPRMQHDAMTENISAQEEKVPSWDADALEQLSLSHKRQETVVDEMGAGEKRGAYSLPRMDHFDTGDGSSKASNDAGENEVETTERARALEEKLARFGIMGRVTSIKGGPVVTLFEYEPDADIKISKILALEDDLALAMRATSIRIIAPIPGRSVVGFEVANEQRRNVLFGDLVKSDLYLKRSGALPLVVGQDTVGNPVVADLSSMPHLLIAGSTGSGKSVALNTMLSGLLGCLRPDELKLILIDPKRLEFSSYSDIAHLLFPIVTDITDVPAVLRWVVGQMEERYEKMAVRGVRSVDDYNQQAVSAGDEPFARIVLIVDELADLMMISGREVEDLIARIAQMARAAGIHMIVATQRPSVDVITGLIKVNFPARISFRVASKVDSRTILDCCGAERLLGRGDMLFFDASSVELRRIHGAYITSQQIADIVGQVRAQQEPSYLELDYQLDDTSGEISQEDEHLYGEVERFIEGVEEISISLLQRRFSIGYNRSARIVSVLEARGRILPSDGSKMRKVIH